MLSAEWVLWLGIGPHRALKLIREYKTMEKALASLDTSKNKSVPVCTNFFLFTARRSLTRFFYRIPENFLYKEASELFRHPDVIRDDDVKVCYYESCLLRFVFEFLL